MRYSGHQVTFHFESSMERSYESIRVQKRRVFRGSSVGSDSFFNQSFAKRVDNVLFCQDYLCDLEDPK